MSSNSNDTWGIIVCRRDVIGISLAKWHRVRECLDKRGVAYDAHVCARMVEVEPAVCTCLEKGYKTLVVVGGDADLNRVVNALMYNTPKGKDYPAIGLIPSGLVNDFARFWGLERSKHKVAIEAIMAGRTRLVDLGRVTFVPEGSEQAEVRYFVNCVNVGLVALIASLRVKTYRFWGFSLLSLLSSALLLLFQKLEYVMRFHINWEQVERKAMTLCIGNCRGYGQTPSAVPYNGLLDVMLMAPPKANVPLLQGLWLLLTNRIMKHKLVNAWRTKRIDFHSMEGLSVSTDGRPIPDKIQRMEVTIQPEVLTFYIP